MSTNGKLTPAQRRQMLDKQIADLEQNQRYARLMDESHEAEKRRLQQVINNAQTKLAELEQRHSDAPAKIAEYDRKIAALKKQYKVIDAMPALEKLNKLRQQILQLEAEANKQ